MVNYMLVAAFLGLCHEILWNLAQNTYVYHMSHQMSQVFIGFHRSSPVLPPIGCWISVSKPLAQRLKEEERARILHGGLEENVWDSASFMKKKS